MSSDDVERDDVLPVLEAIKSYADQVLAKPEGDQASALAYCIKYAFHYMERKSFEDAPLTGEVVDRYEDNNTKVDRVQVTAAVEALISLGILSVKRGGKEA